VKPGRPEPTFEICRMPPWTVPLSPGWIGWYSPFGRSTKPATATRPPVTTATALRRKGEPSDQFHAPPTMRSPVRPNVYVIPTIGSTRKMHCPIPTTPLSTLPLSKAPETLSV
jgi:hypothetical protein